MYRNNVEKILRELKLDFEWCSPPPSEKGAAWVVVENKIKLIPFSYKVYINKSNDSNEPIWSCIANSNARKCFIELCKELAKEKELND